MIYKHDDIQKMLNVDSEPWELMELSEKFPIKYQLTEGEEEWLFNFVRGRYSIADYLINNGNEDDDGNFIVTIDYDFSMVLDEDCNVAGKAVMLSDDSSLQTIFFYNYCEDI